MYEIRGKGVRRFLIAPFAGTIAVITIMSVVPFAAGGWFSLATAIWLAWIEWRASRLGMRADASGITVANLLRRYEIGWKDVRGVWAYEEHSPAAVNIERSRGRFWGVSVHATFGLGKQRRREVALRIAESVARKATASQPVTGATSMHFVARACSTCRTRRPTKRGGTPTSLVSRRSTTVESCGRAPLLAITARPLETLRQAATASMTAPSWAWPNPAVS
jgi:hypothetical protein